MNDGEVAERPMRNSGDGDSDLFAHALSDLMADIGHEPKVPPILHKSAAVLAGGLASVNLQNLSEIGEGHIAPMAHCRVGVGLEGGRVTSEFTMLKIHSARAAFWDGFESADIMLSAHH